MRETYSTLLQSAQDLCVDPTTSSTTALSSTSSFLSRELNNTVQYIFSLIRNYKSQPLPRTFSTVVDQQYYHYPPGLLSMVSLTLSLTTDNHKPLLVVNSQEEWDRLNEITTSGDFPQRYFPRQSDFGIWPIPSAVRTGTLVANFLPQRLSVADYTDGTISISQNSRTVTGSSTAFTSAMVGRWICEADTNGLSIGNWYRLSGYVSGTEMTLETVFEESTLSGSKFIIGQTPEIPEEFHEFLPYRAAAAYFRSMRRDATRAQEYMNYFYTGDDGNPNRGGGIKGGVMGIVNRYKNLGRGDSQIAHLHRTSSTDYIPEAWRTTLS